MKMREFMNALDQLVDLTEAEIKIVEKNPELSEAPSPEDWELQQKFKSVADCIKMLQARIKSFERSFIEHRDSKRVNFDSEEGQEWIALQTDLAELKSFLKDFDY